ncbi:MAG: putative sugar O-methyltransferase [Proteobacteria bacterium]|nr:putative sugar O-methyltransferase [Pseudomonadota bacterium]
MVEDTPQIRIRMPSGFVFSNETSHLEEAEYQMVGKVFSWSEALIAYRTARHSDDSRSLPDNNWSPNKAQSGEIDGSVKNHFTSYALARSLDRDIIRKLLLYAQSFSGFQLATWSPSHLRPWISHKLPDNLDELLRLLVVWPDQYYVMYKAATQLLPQELRVPPPWRYGNVGWLDGEVIVNPETYRYHNHLRILWENQVFEAMRSAPGGVEPRIVEIGSGYGGLAYCLAKIFGNARILLIDLPECLAFAAAYLSVVLPELEHCLVPPDAGGAISLTNGPGVTYVANFMIDRLAPDVIFDLAINTASLTEMTPQQIDGYASFVRSHANDASLFYERNSHLADSWEMASELQMILARHFSRMRECQVSFKERNLRERPRLWQR